jgi:hypothetical protein
MYPDWGELSDEDVQENELSLREGFRLLSAYRTAKGQKIWIITEADRSATTILLPSEYWYKTCSASVTSTRAALAFRGLM